MNRRSFLPSSTTFFSYSRGDLDFALRLAKDLKGAGANVWFDKLDLAAGQLWDLAIEKALASCPRIVVILSPASVNSTNVMDEVAFALERQKSVIPVLYRDCDVPFRLRRLQYIDFRQDYAAGLQELLRSLMPEPIDVEPKLEDAGQRSKPREKAGIKRKATGQTETERQDDSKELLTLRGHLGGIWGVAWAPDGKRLATASVDQTAKVWNADIGRELLTLRGHKQSLRRIAWNWKPHTECHLATTDADGHIKGWDADTGDEFYDDVWEGEGWVLAWKPGVDWLTMNSIYGPKSVFTAYVVTGEGLPFLLHDDVVLSVAWSMDGKRLATGTLEGTTKVWNAVEGTELLTLSAHAGSVKGLAWNPDGNRLATCSDDGTVKVWHATSGKQLLTVIPASEWDEVWSIAWSPDGKRLATGSQDKTARVWDGATGEELLSLYGHSSSVTSVAWSPEGGRLATGSQDSTAKLWDTGK
jgi:WD40 repeat protein